MMSTDTPCSRFAFSHMPTQLFPWELRMNLVCSHYFHRHCWAFVTIQYSSLSFQELSRKELRPLRQKLSSIRKMKRCGKRIQLHCDPDGNASITQQEWLACVLKHSGKDTFLFYCKNEYSAVVLLLKVSKSQNKFMKSSFLPKCEWNILRISALASKKWLNQKFYCMNYVQ